MPSLREFNQLVQEIIDERKPQNGHSGELSKVTVMRGAVTKIFSAKLINFGIRLTSLYFKIKRQDEVQPLPAVCVLSLSKDQLFNGKSQEELLEFFKEERFGNMQGEILIETRLPQISSSKSKSYKMSIAIDLLFNRLHASQKTEVISLSKLAIDLYFTDLNPEEKTRLRTIYALFELAFWFVIRKEQITFITTQSSMTQLPVSFRIPNSSFTRKMLWYSTNSQPFVSNSSPIVDKGFGKALSGHVDMHYVWDHDSRMFLESNGISKVSAVGSILFVKPKNVTLKGPGFNLIYFDVTPLEMANDYYTVDRMCKNLCALIEVVERLSIETEEGINLLVKPKRNVNKSHSKKYIKLLASFEKEGKIQLIEPYLNLYGLIKSADILVGIPFTSPVVVGRELGISSAFMDVHSDEYLVPREHNEFPVLTDQNLLTSWLRESLNAKRTI